MYTATVFRDLLQHWGVTCSGKIQTGITPEGINVLYRHRSKTLAEIVMDLNYYSNNFIAEQLLKTLGAEFYGPPGTSQKGADIIMKALDKIGWNTDSLRISDGSGLSRGNKISPSLLTYMLFLLYNDQRFRYEYIRSLPVGGVNGTVKNRMKNLGDTKRIRAKSGRIRGVNATSGYIFPEGFRIPLAFSILVNNFRGSHHYVMSVQDRFIETILNHYKNAKAVRN
jgi:D-alanyl-D-alanine carboxypeptidase/D-alanyl-D-alanine-endopeptidase (penicillin-binding protein 4)